jgi:hypothetical protein
MKSLFVSLMFMLAALLIPSVVNAQLPIGTVTFQTGTGCPSSTVPTSACYAATVTCPNTNNMVATLKVTNPSVTPIGTIVLFNGGPGTGFYEGYGDIARNTIINPLVADGYRIIQASWASPGWLVGPSNGVASVACRPATLLSGIYANSTLHTPATAYCASGNSGGSSAVMYPLTRYDLETKLDLVVPTSGPPQGRLDEGCLGTAHRGPDSGPAWAYTCKQLGNGFCPLCGFTYTPNGGSASLTDQAYAAGTNACQQAAQYGSATQTWLDQWRYDSVCSLDADVSFPQTMVIVKYGSSDTGESVPLGRQCMNSIQSSVTFETVTGAPHNMPTHSGGALSIYNALSGNCIYRH